MALAFGLAVSVGAPVVEAEEACNPCVVQLAKETESAWVRVAGWAGPADTNNVHVLSNGQHGTFDAATETYTPGPSFWQAGMDTVLIAVRTVSDIGEGPRTLVFTTIDHTIVEEHGIDFSGLSDWEQLPQWESTAGPEASVVNPRVWLSDGKLNVLSDPNPGSNDNGIVVDSDMGDDPPHQAVAGSTPIPEQEPPPFGTVSPNSRTDILTVHSIAAVQMQSTWVTDHYEARLRAHFVNKYFDCAGESCFTSWIDVPNPQNYYVEVLAGPHILGLPDGHPGADRWTVRLRIRDLTDHSLFHSEELLVSIDKSEPSPRDTVSRLGAFNTQALDANDNPEAPTPGESVRLSISNVYLYKAYIQAPQSLLFANFEESFYGQSSAIPGEPELVYEGPIESTGAVHTAAQHQGWLIDKGRTLDVFDVVPLGYPTGYVPTNAPIAPRAMMSTNLPENAKEVKLSFELDTKASMARGTYVTVAEMGRVEAAFNTGPMRIFMMVATNGVRHFRARLWLNHPLGLLQTPWMAADSDIVRIGARLRLSEPGKSNGSFRLMVNDQVQEFTGLANDYIPVEWVGVGAITVGYALDDPFEGMNLRYDDLLISYRN